MLNVCMSAALGGPVAVGAVACMTNEDVIDDRTSCYMRGHCVVYRSPTYYCATQMTAEYII